MRDDETRETLAENFPSNSKMQKVKNEPQKNPNERKIEKVVTGVVRKQKRGFGKKLAETFLEDATENVGNYIFHDVLIPAAKSLICDIIGWGGFAEQMLFGSSKGSRTKRDGGRSYTSYGSSYKSLDRDRSSRSGGDDRRNISNVGRARHDFGEIVLETRGEAEEVLSHLVDLTVDYGMATVADLYDLVGITSNFTDNKYGWTDLRNSSVSRVSRGYLINLPRTQPLE